MMPPERNKSGGSSTFQRSISPSGRFCSSSSSAFTSSISTSSSPARSTSPTRITVRGGVYVTSSPSPSIRFSIDHRHKSPNRSISSPNIKHSGDYYNYNYNKPKAWSHGSKKTCMCSPTTHPGSFRCSLHKKLNARTNNNNSSSSGYDNTASYQSHRLFARRSAMTNSLVRIGTVEGDLVKRALAALIRPSSHQQRRRNDFRPRPSRLSVMSKADD